MRPSCRDQHNCRRAAITANRSVTRRHSLRRHTNAALPSLHLPSILPVLFHPPSLFHPIFNIHPKLDTSSTQTSLPIRSNARLERARVAVEDSLP